MAKIIYDDEAEFLSDDTPFEIFESEESAMEAVQLLKSHSGTSGFSGAESAAPKCRRRRPCRYRYCWIQNGQRVCATGTTYCCV